MHEGVVSARLGLPGVPSAAEEVAVARDIAIAEMTGARLHLTHISTRGAIASIRDAKARGLRITCDVTPHHLAMTDDWVAGSRAFAWDDLAESAATARRSSPSAPSPLRLDRPRSTRRCERGVTCARSGRDSRTARSTRSRPTTRPHASVRKNVEFDQAAFGISGLETALSLVLGGVKAGWCDRDTVIRALTTGPRRRARHRASRRRLDRDRSGRGVDRRPRSRSFRWGRTRRCSGRTLRGRVVYAVVGGEARYEGGLRGATTVGSR